MAITSTQTAPPYRVAFLLIDGFALMSFASASEPLRAANLLAGQPLYEVHYLSTDGQAARSSGGALIPVTAALDPAADFALVLVVAGGDPTNFRDKHVFRWLRRMAQRGATLGGVSGGPVILAAAGLMRGYRMTVHWEHRAALQELYPELLLQTALYVMDRQRITCAGGTAPLDLLHALLARQRGRPLRAGSATGSCIPPCARPATRNAPDWPNATPPTASRCCWRWKPWKTIRPTRWIWHNWRP
ncbi:MAG: AraC family transcriptional regulator [Thiolinea sp.]